MQEVQSMFTKDEIWEAVMQLGGQEDISETETAESKKQLFDVLDAKALNRGKGQEAAKTDIEAKAEGEAKPEGEEKKDEATA